MKMNDQEMGKSENEPTASFVLKLLVTAKVQEDPLKAKLMMERAIELLDQSLGIDHNIVSFEDGSKLKKEKRLEYDEEGSQYQSVTYEVVQ
jgi:hypothetical protein